MSEPKWQPVVMVLNQRLECACGALAVFVSGEVADDHYNILDDIDCWCQACFEKEQARQVGGE